MLNLVESQHYAEANRTGPNLFLWPQPRWALRPEPSHLCLQLRHERDKLRGMVELFKKTISKEMLFQMQRRQVRTRT